MNSDHIADESLLTCSVCMKEIPDSVALSTEGKDYVLHFCGADCFSQWEKRAQPDDKKPQQ